MKQTRHGADRGSYARHAIGVAETVLRERLRMPLDGQCAGPPASPEDLGKLAS